MAYHYCNANGEIACGCEGIIGESWTGIKENVSCEKCLAILSDISSMQKKRGDGVVHLFIYGNNPNRTQCHEWNDGDSSVQPEDLNKITCEKCLAILSVSDVSTVFRVKDSGQRQEF